MIRCIAIDDEPKALDIISSYAKKIPSINLLKTFRSAIDALDFMNNESIDLIFLDINMPDLTGIAFLQSLNQKPMVIFTTAFSEYAIESYDWNAIDYLLKPIEFPRFLKALNKTRLANHQAGHKINDNLQEDDSILIKSGIQTFRVKLKDILFTEASGNYVKIITKEKVILSLTSLNEIQKLLPEKLFCRIHKSFIVSIFQTDVIENYMVRIGEHQIPIGRTYKNSVVNLLVGSIKHRAK